jgi:2-oxoglutarate ferredoxin oxidoreductase subunit alpha
MQGDMLKNAMLSHGDVRHPLLLPSSPEECFVMAQQAFDLAEYFQTPVFVNTDLDLGMNNWMADPFPYPDKPLDRGKVLSAEDLDRLGGFARYKDIDGDGVGWRTLPGTNHHAASYFTRGSGHNEKAQYSERSEDYVNNMDRLAHKFETMRAHVAASELQEAEGAAVGILCCGTSRYAAEESRDQLAREYGLNAAYLRILAWPFPPDVNEFIDRHERVYVIDQNRDAQLFAMLRLDVTPQRAARLRSVRYYTGLPIDARSVTDDIVKQEGL